MTRQFLIEASLVKKNQNKPKLHNNFTYRMPDLLKLPTWNGYNIYYFIIKSTLKKCSHGINYIALYKNN